MNAIDTNVWIYWYDKRTEKPVASQFRPSQFRPSASRFRPYFLFAALVTPMVLVVQPASFAAPPPFTQDKRVIRIDGAPAAGDLCVQESGLVFGAPPATRSYFSLYFFVDGGYLRASVRPNDVVPKEDIPASRSKLFEKNGWYVTADYSARPPRVILVKEPTRYSRWLFVRIETPGPLYYHYYLKNENDLNKDAWLTVEERGKTDRGGIAKQPILSFEKGIALGVEDEKDVGR
jgi:hypothetical protein